MRKNFLIAAALLLSALITGCGKTDDALAQYKTDMTEFTNTVDALVTAIDNIDLDSDTRTEEMLGYLDKMETAFAEMGDLDVPEQFANIEELADEASENLSQAVALYHQAFDDSGEYDPQIVDAALEYYSRAFKRLDYIGTILQGELPEDETITIIHESEDGNDGSDIESGDDSSDSDDEK